MTTEEYSTDFWKDIPDEILEELYQQLENQPSGVPGELISTADYEGGNSQLGWYKTEQTGVRPSQLMGGEAHDVVMEEDSMDVDAAAANANEDEEPNDDAADELDSAVSTAYAAAAPPTSPLNSQAKAVIDQIYQLQTAQEQQLDTMRQSQLQMLLAPQKEGIATLQDQQTKLMQQIDMELKELYRLHSTVVLEPSELHQSRVLITRLQTQQTRIELLRQELNNLVTPSKGVTAPAVLAIIDQPIPQVVFKGKTLEDSYVVHLLTASNVHFKSISKFRAVLISDENANWKTNRPIENDLQAMDLTQRSALFHNIKINVSTRMSMVCLKFTMQAQLDASNSASNTAAANTGGMITVESPNSFPLIVITNESQWCDAAGKLLMLQAFGGQAEIPWAQFANVLHTHFIKASRQDAARPARKLNHGEFSYIHAKFFGSQAVVTQQQVGRFWNWFGQVLQTLRFKRHINNLWFAGLIYGFITKNTCNQVLQHENVGTFLIRFSENFPGLFAIAYVDEDPYERIKHYLVKPEDISSNKSLPDFIREKPQFVVVKQLDPATGQLKLVPKDTAFGAYYSKRKKNTSSNGYVLL